jgi:hypothetical protein
MPGFDRTGPRSMGSVTGGGRGFCASPGGAGRPTAGGRAFFGRGGVHGWRNCYYATGLPRWQRPGFGVPFSRLAPEDEKQALKNEADFLRARLHALEERLAALSAEDK